MKNRLILLSLLAIPFIAMTQETIIVTTTETANDSTFRSGRSDGIEFLSDAVGTHGIYFGLGISLAQLGKNDYVGVETRFAYVADQKFEIGLAGEVFHNINRLESNRDSSTYIAGALGGIHLKAIIKGKKKVHFSIPLLFGGGSTSVYTDYKNIEGPDDSWAAFLFIEPGANVEFNINRVLGFEIGAKYLLTTDSDINADYYENLSGLKVQAMLKIGVFGLGQRNKKTTIKTIERTDGDFLEF